jgi:cell division protein FtsI (penicillin-binding protein 3)
MSERDSHTRPPKSFKSRRPPAPPAPPSGRLNRGARSADRPEAPVRKVALTPEGRVVGSNRDRWIFVAFCFAAAVLIGQLVHLQVFAAPDLREESQAQRTSNFVIPAQRGTIYDRNGNVLAKSVEATTIYANPQQIENPRATANVLAEVLGGEAEDYYEKLIEDTTFVYIIQKADVEQAEQLRERNSKLKEELEAIPRQDDSATEPPKTALYGIDYLTDTKRVYPYGSTGAQVIGMVGTENQGLFGLEQMYDNVLRGTDGTLTAEYSLAIEQRPLSGQPIPGAPREEVAPIDGQDIILSIDIELQRYLESELARMGTERETDNGNALVLDGASGEIYASASLPLIDRDNLTVEAMENDAAVLKSICFNYELGSIFKPLTAAAVLEEQAMDVEEEIFVPAYRTYGEYVISDSHERPDATMSFRTIIAQSSNVGMSYVQDRISNEVFAGHLEDFGIGQPTHVDFPHEGVGILDDWEAWPEVQAANISFGQGVSTSSLQMASFYGAVANDGIKYQPHFLMDRPSVPESVGFSNKSKQVMRPGTARALTDMLVSVVDDGTGHASRIEGYSVAGKTGTAQKASPDGGYLDGEYIVSFVGFFASSQSKLVCITSMDNPTGAEGNAPTGPLFASIMEFAANRYMIEPLEPLEPLESLESLEPGQSQGDGE